MYNIKNKNNRNRSGTLGLIMGIICIFGIVYAVFIINLAHGYHNAKKQDNIPMVINTWSFTNATKKAWIVVYKEKRSALDAVESGCYTCQEEQCDTTVGYGGSPDENGETTLDAMIMDGSTMNVGAVADLRRIKNAISVARHVLEHTTHSIIVGNQASEFAKMMGFKEESLETNVSLNMWKKWKENHCQPNFWMKVYPNPMKSCGPYKPELSNDIFKQNYNFNNKNHDTIGIIVIDNNMNIAAGTSTNGAKNKIPGRVGDSPIPGAGAYADNDVGAAAATGDGDVLLRFLPSFLAVEEMRKGKSPSEATKTSMKRISSKYPIFFGGIIALNKNGEYGAACHGMEQFHFTIMNPKLNEVTVKSVECTNIEL